MRNIALIFAALLLGTLSFAAQGFAQVVPGDGSSLQNALTTTVKIIKATGGNLTLLSCLNPDATHVAYVQVFNVATATSVTLGTTVPKVSFGLAANVTTTISMDLSMFNGIKIAATSTATGLTAPTTVVDCNVGYQ